MFSASPKSHEGLVRDTVNNSLTIIIFLISFVKFGRNLAISNKNLPQDQHTLVLGKTIWVYKGKKGKKKKTWEKTLKPLCSTKKESY